MRHNIGFVGSTMTSSKERQNIPHSWCHQPKTPRNFFSFYCTRLHESLQGLNSSLAQSAAELWLTKVWPEMANVTFCETFWFLSKARFLRHNFSSRYANKLMKSSKDTDHSLVSKKNLSQKMANWVRAKGQANSPKMQKHVLIVMSPTENHKWKNIFYICSRRFAESVEGLNSSLAQSAVESWHCKLFKKSGARGT